MDVVEKLLCLDATLRYLASARSEAANRDDIGRAAEIDTRWSAFDSRRQEVTEGATDNELVAYEIARHTLSYATKR